MNAMAIIYQINRQDVGFAYRIFVGRTTIEYFKIVITFCCSPCVLTRRCIQFWINP